MSDTREDIENGNTKEAIENQVQSNGVIEPCPDEPQGDKEEVDKPKNPKCEDSKIPENGDTGIPTAEDQTVLNPNDKSPSKTEDSKCKEHEDSKIPKPEDCKIPKPDSKAGSTSLRSWHAKKNEAWRKKMRPKLKLDIPSAQKEIPVLSVIPATGSASHYSPVYNDDNNNTPNSPNSCVQCLVTAKLVWTLLVTALDQITDAMAIERFFRMGQIFLFVLSLIFFIVPTIIMCIYATKKLRRKYDWPWMDCVSNFFIAPYWLIIVNISNSLKIGSAGSRHQQNAAEGIKKDEILREQRALSTLHSLEGSLEAIPQVYIQIAAYMTLPITSQYDEVVARLPLTISVIQVAWSVVANLDVGTTNVFWGGVHRLFAASEVGVAMTTRAMVAGAMFFQLYPGMWQFLWLLPIVFSVLATWFVIFFSVRSFKDLLTPLKKGLALPPADIETICGLVPFVVASICLLPSTYEPLLYFIGFEFLAGLSWFCFTLPKDGNLLIE